MAALLTLIGVSGSQTYAKYVEITDVTSTTATVAKWGIVMTANADNLFANAYDNYDSVKKLVTVKADSGTVVASADADANVLAPGCAGSFTFSISGTTEVMTVIDLNFATSTEIHLKGISSVDDYYPVKWTLKHGSDTLVNGGKLSDVMNYEIASGVKLFTEHTITPTVDVPHDLTVSGFCLAGNYEISYVWDYSVDTATDTKDSYLGYLAAGLPGQVDDTKYDTSNSVLDTDFTFSMTATQVQFA